MNKLLLANLIFTTRLLVIPVLQAKTSYHQQQHKMVRFFRNAYDDYKPGVNVSAEPDNISKKIQEHIAIITKKVQPKNVDGGFYVGATGIAYMFYHLSKNPLLHESKLLFLEKALEYTNPALTKSCGEKLSFLLGDAGTLALAAVLYNVTNNSLVPDAVKRYQNLYDKYLPLNFLRCGSDEFFVGRAGYIAGTLWMRRELNQPVLTDDQLFKLCDVIVASGRQYSKKNKSRSPLMYHYYNTEYLGAAHGISFILQMLLSVPGYLEQDPSAAKDIELACHYIRTLQTEKGNWPSCMEEADVNDHKLVHWCHGAPGVIYLMAKAYLVFKDARFLESCVKAGQLIWKRGLLYKGPGICHGVAGNGYAFLLLYRLTNEEKYLYRAQVFAEFMDSEEFLRDSKTPDNPESLYEGTAGTVLFLSDLTHPDSAEFPFQDVFSNYSIS